MPREIVAVQLDSRGGGATFTNFGPNYDFQNAFDVLKKIQALHYISIAYKLFTLASIQTVNITLNTQLQIILLNFQFPKQFSCGFKRIFTLPSLNMHWHRAALQVPIGRFYLFFRVITIE